MTPGRKKIPGHLKILHGTDRPERTNRLKHMPAGDVRPPQHLDRTARSEWRKRVAELVELGIFGERDRVLLALWCSTWSRLVRAEKVLNDKGDVHTTATGYPVPRPELAIVVASGKTLERLAGHFGFSPIARTRLELPPIVPLPQPDAKPGAPTPSEIEQRFFGSN